MGWAVLAGSSWIAGDILLQGFVTRTNQFNGEIYSGFGSLDVDECLGLAIACLGLAAIEGVAAAALRGRISSLLMHDMAGDDEEPKRKS